MKLRYYLRGLGIGIFVTALIMGASGREAAPLTDAEIKAKAAALGMIESDARKLTDVTPTAKPTEESSAEATAKPTEEPSAEATAKPAAEPSAEAAVKPAEESSAEATAKPAAEPSVISVTVKSGYGSDTVARQLEEAGLVESAADFDRYLIDHGYSKRISVGTYEIIPGTSEEEIAKIITKTR